MWHVQREFNQHFIDHDEATPEQRINYIKELVLGLHSELDEVLDELNWKAHRNVPSVVIESNLLEEMVDVLKFSLSLFTTWGFTAQQIEDEFMLKSAVVEQRYAQELMLPEGGKIVGVDIDGVLAEYVTEFIKYACAQIGKSPDGIIADTLRLSEPLGIDEQTYIDIKRQWRESGAKATLPVVAGAKEMLASLRARGFTIVLLSARPYQEHKRIFSDTMIWLDHNGLEYDAILFDDHKNERLLKEYGADRIAFFVEDDRGHANRIANCGVKVYLLAKTYNEMGMIHPNVKTISSLEEVQ